MINWSTGDTSATIMSLPAGSYSVTVVDGAGCSDIQTFAISEPARISVDIVNITPATGQNNADGAIDISVTGGVSPFSYEWRRNGELIASTEDLIAVLPGTYEIIVRDKNGCTIIGAEIIVPISGVATKNEHAPTILIYPNPADSRVFISSSDPIIKSAKIEIFDLLGRGVAAQLYTHTQDEKYFDTGNLPTGSYFIRVVSGTRSWISKVVIHR